MAKSVNQMLISVLGALTSLVNFICEGLHDEVTLIKGVDTSLLKHSAGLFTCALNLCFVYWCNGHSIIFVTNLAGVMLFSSYIGASLAVGEKKEKMNLMRLIGVISAILASILGCILFHAGDTFDVTFGFICGMMEFVLDFGIQLLCVYEYLQDKKISGTIFWIFFKTLIWSCYYSNYQDASEEFVKMWTNYDLFISSLVCCHLGFFYLVEAQGNRDLVD